MELDREEENGHYVSDEYLVKLIELVKGYSALYDPQKPDFNNKTMKGFYWKEVQRQLEEQGFSTSEAKKAYQRYNSLKKKLLKEQTRLDVMGIPDVQRLDRARFRYYKQMMEFYPYIEQQNAQKAQLAANFIRPSQFNASRPIDLSLLAVIAANSEPERNNLIDLLDSPKEMTKASSEKIETPTMLVSGSPSKKSDECETSPIALMPGAYEDTDGPTSSKKSRNATIVQADQIDALVETIGSVVKQLPYERALPILVTTLTNIQQEIKITKS